MSLTDYSYPQASQFLREPSDHWKGMNFRGEVYEAAFYEFMRDSLVALGRDGLTLVAKGPFAPTPRTARALGFQHDNSGGCLYMDSGISLAEFDCMTIGAGRIQFYECTLTSHRENLKALKAESLRKISLLQTLFPNHAVTCIVVCDSAEIASPFAGLEGFETYLFDPDLPDLVSLARTSRLQPQALLPGMVPIDALNKQSARFSYLDEVARRSSLLPRRGVLAAIEKLDLCANGLFPRLYWGHVAAEDVAGRTGATADERVIVAINFSEPRPKVRYYYIERRTNHVYEALVAPKRLNSYQASRAEILAVAQVLPNLSREDVEGLEAEIRARHQDIGGASRR